MITKEYYLIYVYYFKKFFYVKKFFNYEHAVNFTTELDTRKKKYNILYIHNNKKTDITQGVNS
jgi:hypothetical protein